MILILTPLKIERDALARALRGAYGGGGVADETIEVAGRLVARFGEMWLAVGGHGKVEFALSAQALVEALRPSLVVCAGGGGSLLAPQELPVLSVVIGRETVEHDFRLRFVRKGLPRFAGSKAHIERLQAAIAGSAAAGGGGAIQFGSIASGDEDVIDAKRAGEIRQDTGEAVVVAWEGAGGARAALRCGVPFLEVRVVVDHAGATAAADYSRHIAGGMTRIADVLKLL